MKFLEILGIEDTKEKRQNRFFKAIVENDIEKLKKLLKTDIDINAVHNGNTALTLAVSKLNDRIIQLLLDNGADINVKNSSDDTPLMVAVKKNYTNIAQYLISKGASAFECDRYENSPLIIASSKGNLQLVSTLLKYSGMIDQKNNTGATAYSCAATTQIKQMIKNKANSYLLDLMQSSLEDSFLSNRIRPILEAGADIDTRDSSGNTALILAVSANKLLTLQKLIGNGANINSKNNSGFTALILAVWNDYKDMVHTLLKKDADIQIESQNGVNAYNCVSREYKNTLLHQSINEVDFNIIKKIIEMGANINAKNSWGGTPLHIAAQKHDLETIKLLVEKGADITATDNDGRSPYRLAGSELYSNECSTFIREQLNKLLIKAISENQTEMATSLIKACANVNATDEKGITAISYAAFVGNKSIIKALISGGADIYKKCNSNHTALEYSKSNEIRQFILETFVESYNKKSDYKLEDLKKANSSRDIHELEESARFYYNRSAENSLERAYAAERVAATLRFQEKFDEALKYYNEALQNSDYSNTIGEYKIKGVIHRAPRREYVQIKINNINAKKNLLKNTLVKDIIMAPQLYEEYTGDKNAKHISRINDLRTFINSNGKLPNKDKICLTIVSDKTNTGTRKLQVLDGNHRLLALALQNPNAKIGDISEQLIEVHTKKTIKMFQHFHVYTNFASGVEPQEIGSSDGAVKRLYRGPVYFRDPEIFRAPNLKYGSFGQTVGKTLQDMRI